MICYVSEVLIFGETSVYHTEIADNLCRATAQLCERAAISSQLVMVIEKTSMQRELAEMYKHLFLFLLETAQWFNKPSFSRFFDSFNKALKQEHDITVLNITNCIDIIKERGWIEGLMRVEDIRQTSDILEQKLDIIVPRIASIEQYLGMIVDESRTQGQFQQY